MPTAKPMATATTFFIRITTNKTFNNNNSNIRSFGEIPKIT
jgi:hypothetical protein